MIPLKYAYLTGCLLFFIPWLILFWHRPDLRKAMIVLGLIGGLGSLATAYYWTADWWQPTTISGTRIGIEDYILGFVLGGVAVSLYEEIARKRWSRKSGEHPIQLLILAAWSVGLFWWLINVNHLSSFATFIITTTAFAAVMIYLRRDLFISCLLNGLMLVAVAVPVYYISKLVSPSAIGSFYVFPLYPDLRIFGVPIQEFIFYFGFGFSVPLAYEYWHGLKNKQLPAAKQRTKRITV
jgi:hypothetical protein